MISLLLPEIDTEARGRRRCHGNGFLALSKIRMTEHDLVSADGQRHIAEWRLSDMVAVDVDLCPGKGVQAHRTVRHCDRRGGCLAGGDVDAPRHAESESL